MLKSLTPREREVACLISEGLCNKSIAQRLGIVEGTVKVHVHNIYMKLQISNRVRLAISLYGLFI